jgi:hypothetical protein
MMAALGADALIAFEIGTVENGLARRALAPQAFGDGLPDPFDTLDLGGQQFLNPAHFFSSGPLPLGIDSGMGITNISDLVTNGRQAGAILPVFLIFLPFAYFVLPSRHLKGIQFPYGAPATPVRILVIS